MGTTLQMDSQRLSPIQLEGWQATASLEHQLSQGVIPQGGKEVKTSQHRHHRTLVCAPIKVCVPRLFVS